MDSAKPTDNPESRPKIRLLPGRQKRMEQGHPWIYSNEIVLDSEAKALPRGILVTVENAEGRKLGVATFNPNTLIALRLLDRDATRVIDHRFFLARLKRALAIRQDFIARPFYRLAHAEADGLPGLIIDRYADALVCQLNTAGIDRLASPLIQALQELMAPATIIFRNDSSARQAEGLELETRIALGSLSAPVEVEENGGYFLADLLSGQKTGWFFDQRLNRAFAAGLARGRRVLDAYAFSGGFGVQAALGGATEVTLLDRSEAALALASATARRNDVSDRCTFLQGEVFEQLERLNAEKQRFDLVLLDPPAFVKSRKDLGAGSRGYRKLVRLGAALAARGSYLMISSCSHNMELGLFSETVRQGIQDAGRSSRVCHIGGAGPDHPIHPALPESAYLKALTLAID